MEIKPLICPQCGGELGDYSPAQTSATCKYCGVHFVIERKAEPDIPIPAYSEIDDSEPVDSNKIIAAVVVAFAVIIGVVIIGGLASLKNTKSPYNPPIKFASPSPTKPVTGTAAPNPDLLNFGGKGTGNGLFKDANSIAVDKQGDIYVSDDSLRVQQFDEVGQFLTVLQIPQKGANYEHARTIDKIAAGDDGRLYVAVGGVLLVYDSKLTSPVKAIHFAPDYIQDFALRADGGILVVTSNEDIESLIFLNRSGQVTKRITGFHTKAADAPMSPRQVGVESIRLAVDGAGNIFSLYAFGDLGSYSLSYNAEDLLILRFSPGGKYVNKFVQSMNSCGIAVDNQSRIYISEGNNINVYKNNGEMVTSVVGSGRVNAFALDKKNNIYLLRDDKVAKRWAID